MKTNTDKIKLAAQFLFDNASEIAGELAKSENYRNFVISIDHFKQDETISVIGTVYDSVAGHQHLTQDHITANEFEIACRAINVQSGVIVVEDNSIVRDELEVKSEQ